MPHFSPEFLARAASGYWTREPAGALTGFGIDTRSLRPGDVFVAIKTAARDGHAFLGAASAAGASAALVSVPDATLPLPQLVVADPLVAFQQIAAAHRRTFTGPVIGVSGSAGKTSTKNLLALLLASRGGEVLATEGNLNNHLGVPLTLTRLDPAVHRFAVIEAGIGGPGEMAPLAAMIAPDLAIITLVAPAHLEALGSLEGVAREKALLAAATREGGLKLFPSACASFASFRDLPAPARAVDAVVTQTADATRIHRALLAGFPAFEFTCRRVSDGMALNAALAIEAAFHLGVSASAVQLRLSGWRPAALRGELRRDSAGRWLYVDCYNANPASMLDALAVFTDLAPAASPRLFIVGGMEELGGESLRYHRELGVALAALLRPSDSAVVLAAPAAAAAVVEAASGSSVIAAPDLGAVRARFEAFTGAVFIKGSRRYQLEFILSPAGEIAVANVH
jgi:UDP-N-acetylmuramoyl-tripeptide--D-alanyl-D-alanine ligase